MADYDDMNVPMIAFVGVLGVILTVAIIVGLQALYYNYNQVLFEKRILNEPFVESDSRLAEQEAKLNSPYRWIDQEKGIVAVPIDRAKELVVRELEQKQKQQETGHERKPGD